MSALRAAVGAALLAAAAWSGGAAAQVESLGLDDEAFIAGLLELELDRAVELLIARRAAAGDPIDALDAEAALARLRVRAARTAAQRERAVAALLDAQRRRLETPAAPPTRVVRLATLAEDLVATAVWDGGAAARALVGAPDAATRGVVARRAAEALEHAAAAEAALPDALRDLERAIAAGDEDARTERRSLAESLRNARLPLVRARARALAASPGDPAAWRLVRDDAALAAEALDGAALDAARLHEGLALLRLGEHAAAAALLGRVADEPRAQPLARLVAQIARAEAAGGTAATDALSALAGAAEAPAFDRVLALEALVRLGVASAATASAPERGRRLEALVTTIDRIVAGARSADRELLRRGARAALAAAVPVTDDGRALPREVVVAHAEAALAAQPSDPARAIALLEPRVGATDRVDGEIAWLLGLALADAGRSAEAAERFLASARASGRGAEAVARTDRAAGAAWIAVQTGDERAAPTLEAAIDLRLSLEPAGASADRWRVVAGRRALARGDAGRALALAGAVPADSPSAGDAAWIAISALRARRTAGDAAAPSTAAMLQRVRDAQATVAQWRAPERADDRAWYASMLSVVEAETLLAAEGPAGALARLEALDAADLPIVVRTEALRVRMAALREAGRLHEARDAVARLVERAPEAAVPAVRALVREVLARIELRRDDGRDEEARAIAGDELAPLADMLETALGAARSEASDPAWRDLAAALLVLERWGDAEAAYDRLLVREPDAADLLLGRAEALFGAGGRDADAMRLYQRLAAADATAFPREHWTAQLRMLEILVRNGRDLDKIAPRVRRLRALDPQLGGPTLKRAFDRLERTPG